MAIEVTDLQTLDAAAVQQEMATLATRLQELHPTLDLKRGVFADLVLYYGAILAAKNQTEQDRLRRSMSLAAIQADPTLADDTMVDNLAATLGASRLPGSNALGTVAIVLDALVAVSIPAGAMFTAQGQTFTATAAFAARTSSAYVTGSTDRLITALSDGTYVFTITVEAVAEGLAGRLSKGTLLIPEQTISHFAKAYATEDFTGGTATETNAQLSARLVYGLATKAFSGREQMSAALRSQVTFAGVLADSIIGLGDGEMHRDQHSLIPMSLGGRVDWYVRTQELPSRISLTKTATLVQKTNDGYGIWQFGLARDEAAGFYDIEQIAPNDAGLYAGSFAITEDVRGFDLASLTASTFLPDVETAAEAAYSRFQTAVIRFKDTLTATAGLAVGATADYAVTVRAMPLIAEIQDYALSRGVRNPMGDCLVRAPIPCFVSVSCLVEIPYGQTASDTAVLASALAAAVNSLGFVEKLSASLLMSTLMASLPGGSTVSALSMLGRLRRPDGTASLLTSNSQLEIPNLPADSVTYRTTAFYLDPSDVAIAVQTATALDV